MGCGCNKGRVSGATAAGSAGTYKVLVAGRQVYESSNKTAADQVASRFDNATVVGPDKA